MSSKETKALLNEIQQMRVDWGVVRGEWSSTKKWIFGLYIPAVIGMLGVLAGAVKLFWGLFYAKVGGCFNLFGSVGRADRVRCAFLVGCFSLFSGREFDGWRSGYLFGRWLDGGLFTSAFQV